MAVRTLLLILLSIAYGSAHGEVLTSASLDKFFKTQTALESIGTTSGSLEEEDEDPSDHMLHEFSRSVERHDPSNSEVADRIAVSEGYASIIKWAEQGDRLLAATMMVVCADENLNGTDFGRLIKEEIERFSLTESEIAATRAHEEAARFRAGLDCPITLSTGD